MGKGVRSNRLMMVASSLSVAAAALLSGCSGPAEQNNQVTAMEKYPTPLDLAAARTECLKSKGWQSELNRTDGTIITDYPASKAAQYQEDDAACFEELGVDPQRDLTTSEYDSLYDQHLAGKKCLEEIGVQISSPPSRQVFQESYQTDPWLPWVEVPEMQRAAALKKCPPPPPIY